MRKSFIISGLLFVVLFSCTKERDKEETPVTNGTIVSKKDALAKLSAFLSEEQTKSMESRTIESVGTYYGSRHSHSSDPIAYVVNFSHGKGFAILGANTGLDDIIAVIDNGQIDPETLTISSDETLLTDSKVFKRNASFVKQLIEVGVNSNRGGGGGEGGDGSGIIDWDEDPVFDPPLPGLGGGIGYYTHSPLLSYSWGQDTPHNLYCYNDGNNLTITGCSTTAMAMIVAHNEFPQLQVNGVAIDWQEIKSEYFARYLDLTYQNHVALLMGSIYHFVKKDYFGESVCIFPKEIKRRLEEFGYTNVTKHCSFLGFSSDMIMVTSDMLLSHKPVFISAVPGLDLANAHSWVIDGAKYSPSNCYLLHFNFGWVGHCNGYFSTSCLNPSQGFQYDNNYTYDPDDDYTYNWHFRLVTYDIPTENQSYEVFF